MRICLIALPFALAACTDAAPPDAGVGYACDGPVALVLVQQNALRSDCLDKDGQPCTLPAIALPAHAATALTFRAEDDEGRPCDPSDLAVAIDDERFAVAEDGGAVTVTPAQDIFDLGAEAGDMRPEPSATLTAVTGGLRFQWRVLSVVDLSGTWEITVDDLTVGDFGAAQIGRFIRWDDCPADDADPKCASGVIQSGEADLFSPVGTLRLKGWIWATRQMLNGVWLDTSTGDQGFWAAAKVADP